MSIANIIFSFSLAYLAFKQVRPAHGFRRVLISLAGLVGLYWGLLYCYIFLTPSGAAPIDAVLFGQVLVRPAFTFTLAVMASIAVFRWRSGLE